MSGRLSPCDDAMAVVRAVIDERAHLQGALLPVLHGVQAALGHVPGEAVPEIAQALNLSRAEVHGVLSYYTHFRRRPAGRCVGQVCTAESCQAMGGAALLAHARAKLGCSDVQPTSANGAFTVQPVACLGLCAMSPALSVNDQPHARMTPAQLDALLATEKR